MHCEQRVSVYFTRFVLVKLKDDRRVRGRIVSAAFGAVAEDNHMIVALYFRVAVTEFAYVFTEPAGEVVEACGIYDEHSGGFLFEPGTELFAAAQADRCRQQDDDV